MSNAYFRSIKKCRQAWADSMPQRCMLCRRRNCQLDIHEILRRSQAPKSWSFNGNFLLLCRQCHDSPLITHSGHWSLCVQLGVKALRDPESYDLEKWNRVRNERAPNYATQEDVDVALFEYMTGQREC